MREEPPRRRSLRAEEASEREELRGGGASEGEELPRGRSLRGTLFIEGTSEALLHFPLNCSPSLDWKAFFAFRQNSLLIHYASSRISSCPGSVPIPDQLLSRISSCPESVPIPDQFLSRISFCPGSVPIPDQFPSRISSCPGSVPVPDQFLSRISSHRVFVISFGSGHFLSIPDKVTDTV
ncbi:hypothetical protein BV898_04969 [Hypsibius exemplaris]|uniref:Uncharacterized protein n=1 Tax=Hypsibius exemplaris TaxID=2072580 RepID=A0A1W0X196_HYPEX|nr:hypothetical protein BV898_04969 [Hypsibius exemplaris]